MRHVTRPGDRPRRPIPALPPSTRVAGVTSDASGSGSAWVPGRSWRRCSCHSFACADRCDPGVGATRRAASAVWATLVAMAAGLPSTAIGVYGGVLVPGLLLLGVDARFAAAASLFLQVLVIPLGAGAHYRMGNVSRSRRAAADRRRHDRRVHRTVLRRRSARGRHRATGGGDDRRGRRAGARDAALRRPGEVRAAGRRADRARSAASDCSPVSHRASRGRAGDRSASSC